MGVDAEIYVFGPVSDDEMRDAEAFCADRLSGSVVYRGKGDDGPDLVRRTTLEGQPIVALDTWSRLYEVGYERGPWPEIYGAIMTMQAAFPGRSVYYGGDSTDSHPVATPERLASLWAHFLGPDGLAYHGTIRARQAQISR